jgi:hypothetical protein
LVAGDVGVVVHLDDIALGGAAADLAAQRDSAIGIDVAVHLAASRYRRP